MKRTPSIFVLPVLIFLTGCTSPALVHPELAQRKAAIHKVAVLIPNVAFYRVTFSTRECQPIIETNLRSSATNHIAIELATNCFAISLPDWKTLAPATNTKHDLEFEQALARALIKTNFYEMPRLRDANRRATPQERKDAQLLAKAADADALLLVSVLGFETSGGRKAVSIGWNIIMAGVAGVAAYGGASFTGSVIPWVSVSGATGVEAVLVEGNTGEPLWANVAWRGGDTPDLERIIHKLFKPFKKSAENAPAP